MKQPWKPYARSEKILEARLRYTQEYLSEVHAEMMEMKLKATTMKKKIEDFNKHVAQF